jgi:hypothetical protein
VYDSGLRGNCDNAEKEALVPDLELEEQKYDDEWTLR